MKTILWTIAYAGCLLYFMYQYAKYEDLPRVYWSHTKNCCEYVEVFGKKQECSEEILKGKYIKVNIK